MMNRRDAIKAVLAMPAVARIGVVELKPDDVIVFECDEHISCEQGQRIREMAEKVWPGRKVAVLDKGLHLKIVAQDKVPV